MTIAVRKDRPPTQASRTRPDTAPSRMLRALYRWDPFREMEPFFTATMLEDEDTIAFDVEETDEALRVRADLPDVREGDISIRLSEDLVTICGGSFARSFTLPEGSDLQNARADLKDGVLLVVVPRKKA